MDCQYCQANNSKHWWEVVQENVRIGFRRQMGNVFDAGIHPVDDLHATKSLLTWTKSWSKIVWKIAKSTRCFFLNPISCFRDFGDNFFSKFVHEKNQFLFFTKKRSDWNSTILKIANMKKKGNELGNTSIEIGKNDRC